MAKVILSERARLTDRIIRCLPKQVIIAKELGISPQTLNHRLHKIYPNEIKEVLTLLDLAGYEVVEKGSV